MMATRLLADISVLALLFFFSSARGEVGSTATVVEAEQQQPSNPML